MDFSSFCEKCRENVEFEDVDWGDDVVCPKCGTEGYVGEDWDEDDSWPDIVWR